MAAFEAGELQFFADLAYLNQAKVFAAAFTALRTVEWAVYAKQTFAGPEQLLAYLARYTHRVAITNSRLLELDESHVSIPLEKLGRVAVIRAKLCASRPGVHAPLPPPRPTEWLSSHSSLRALGNGHRAEKLALCRNLLDVPSAPADRRMVTTTEPDP